MIINLNWGPKTTRLINVLTNIQLLFYSIAQYKFDLTIATTNYSTHDTSAVLK